MSIAACIISPTPRPKPTRRRAKRVRRFLNAASADEIVFTRSATEAINLVAASFGLAHIGAGDEIVLSVMEHHSNIVPWHFQRERKGAVLRWVDVDDDGSFSLDAFEQRAERRGPRSSRSRICRTCSARSPPIKEIVRHRPCARRSVLVDGSQGAVHLDVDVRDLDVDFYVVTGHKLYGPTGIGVLYGKRELLEALPPFNGGGEMIEEVTRDSVTYNEPPHRFEAGTPPIVQAIGLGAALDYMEGIGRARIRAHEEALSAYAHERLSGDQLAADLSARRRARGRSCRSTCRARMRMTSRRSSTARASRCAPARIARCRCCSASASPRPAAPPSRSTTRATKSTRSLTRWIAPRSFSPEESAAHDRRAPPPTARAASRRF